MTHPVPFGPALLALILLGAGLAATLAIELEGDAAAGAMPDPAPRPLRLPAPAATLTATADPTGPWVAVILARPLFEAQRRPPAPGAEPVETGLPRLTGVLVGPFGRSAIFAGPAGGRPVVVEEGGRIGGYVVQSIRPDEATLLGPGGRRVLHTAFDPNAAPGRAPPAARLPGETPRRGQ